MVSSTQFFDDEHTKIAVHVLEGRVTCPRRVRCRRGIFMVHTVCFDDRLIEDVHLIGEGNVTLRSSRRRQLRPIVRLV